MITVCRSAARATAPGLGPRVASAEGAQLLEFALAMPLLLVLVVGIIDFGGAYNLKQILNNGAREGARYAVSQSSNNLDETSTATPNEATAIGKVVANYLTNAGVTQCTIGAPSIATTSTSAATYTYTSSSTGCSSFKLRVDRDDRVPNGTATIISTHVTLTYPWTWNLGRIIGQTSPTTISTDCVMENIQ